MARLEVNLSDVLRRYDLLGSAELDAYAREILPRFPEAGPACDELVRRGWLTRFQADELAHDRGPSLVLGSYVLIEAIGHGGMGQLFKARHRLMRRTVAIKLIKPECMSRSTAVARFLREIHLLARLSHPNVVLAHDAEQVDGRYFLVMEYCDGVDLGRLIRTGGPLSVGLACEYVRQAALGLQHAADQGLVHRDIKPDNLFVVNGVVKVLDFGLSCLREPEQSAGGSISSPGDFLGTPDYAAPEQINDIQSADVRSDLYSLGCTLYFVLTGKPPFPGGGLMDKLFRHQQEEPRPVRQIRPEVPAEVQAIIARLLAKNPTQRFAEPKALADALAPFCVVGSNAGTLLPRTIPVVMPTQFGGSTPADRDEAASTAAYVPRSRVQTKSESRRAKRVARSPYRRLGILAGVVVTPIILIGAVSVWGFLTQERVGAPRPSGKQPVENPDPDEPPPPKTNNPSAPSPMSGVDSWTLRKAIGAFPAKNPTCYTFAPDSRHIAVGYGHHDTPTEPGQVLIFTAQGDGPVQTLTGHTHKVFRVRYSPDGSLLASVTGDYNVAFRGELIVWNRQTGKPSQTLEAIPNGAVALAVSRTHVAVGGRLQSVRVWEIAAGGVRNPVDLPMFDTLRAEDCVCSLAFTPDGKFLAAGGNDGAVRVWNVATRELVASPRPDRDCGTVVDLAFDADNDRLVGVTSAFPENQKIASLLVWHLSAPNRKARANDEIGWNYTNLALIPGSTDVLTGDQAGRVRRWDPATKIVLSERRIDANSWIGVALAPDGNTALTVYEKFVHVWNVGKK